MKGLARTESRDDGGREKSCCSRMLLGQGCSSINRSKGVVEECKWYTPVCRTDHGVVRERWFSSA